MPERAAPPGVRGLAEVERPSTRPRSSSAGTGSGRPRDGSSRPAASSRRFVIVISAAERHRPAPHRPCPGRTLQDVIARWQRMQGLPRPLAAGHRPRGHRHPDDGRAPARSRRQDRRPRAREVRRARVGMETHYEGHHPRPDEAPRCSRRLDARALHARPGSLPRGAAKPSSSSDERGPDLPRPVHRQLVPALRHRRLRSRGGPQDVHGKLYEIRYPVLGSRGRDHVATTRPETMLGDTAVAVNPEDERYAASSRPESSYSCRCGREIPIITDDPGGSRVRYGRREGHARARPQRLRDGRFATSFRR